MNTITINGKKTDVPHQWEERLLLDFLREYLHLTGTKNGCGIGVCGACTVLVDDLPRRSCITKVATVLGKNVLTIEGMARPDGSLHPLQQAFLDAGAVQCGFCTPGMVLTAHALLLQHPDPSEEEVKQALKGNLCRCTGYVQIIAAVMNGAEFYRKGEDQ